MSPHANRMPGCPQLCQHPWQRLIRITPWAFFFPLESGCQSIRRKAEADYEAAE